MNLDKHSIFEEGLLDPMIRVYLIDGPGLVAPDFLKFPTMFEYGLSLPIGK